MDLCFSTGYAHIDQIIKGVVGVCEETVPGFISAYYLTGSYAYADPVPTSDIDLLLINRGKASEKGAGEEFGSVLFRQYPPPEEEKKLRRMFDHIRPLLPVRVSFDHRREIDERKKRFHPEFRIHRVLLYGNDIYQDCFDPAEPPISATQIRLRTHRAYRLLCDAHNVANEVHLPLAFPAPEEAFYGYTSEGVNVCGQPHLGLGRFVGFIYPICTALMTRKTGINICRKDTLPETYREHIGDEWTDFVTDMFDVCRKAWHYQVPDGPDDRARLREICAQALGFSNQYLITYRDFLLEELASGEREQVLMAALMMAQKSLKDSRVMVALKAHANSEDDEIRQTIASVLSS